MEGGQRSAARVHALHAHPLPRRRRCRRVQREFDASSKSFVEDGFYVPEAKANVGWKDENTLWIGSDFGEGSLTTSGYPRIAKMWKRGTPLESAATVFQGSVNDVAVAAYSIHTPEAATTSSP